jgi:hypothetical protein
MRVPAVVGSFPEPFVHGQNGKRYPVRIDCAKDADTVCRRAAGELDSAGITASTTALGAPAGKELLRFVIGRWSDVRQDAAARELESGPAKSGVFARFVPAGAARELELLDRNGAVARRVAGGAGIVAATRFEDQQPTWVVTGLDEAGLEVAAGLLRAPLLRNRFAVAAIGGQVTALPAGGPPSR